MKENKFWDRKTVLIMYGLVFLTMILGYFVKSILIFLPVFLVYLAVAVVQLYKGQRILLNTFLSIIITVALIILLTQANVLDIPFLKRMTG